MKPDTPSEPQNSGVRRLTDEETERLRQEMAEASAWMREELARRREQWERSV
jgi:hypothetical protein